LFVECLVVYSCISTETHFLSLKGAGRDGIDEIRRRLVVDVEVKNIAGMKIASACREFSISES